ncbi:rod shape-determining protein [Paenilisteria rocourtiae]|uniref:Cell shape-determining protein MreB n=1 Tax=Listeria rocourtiae TaxID=647910 RepID=A0A4R6ZST4_9LIST|nr:rod shape-determining protein [Listeria rocourtiae]EUJ43901.1 rod shape-determining protein MreB [Listeria rocourtiae FSL F6-920]MBC1435672.1 rod shape-determining protein [Listeria rocourtiae]MBC1605164.1 rod shape-determining protein [Listeria rocourtiae]TDR55675.1 rod shape-determining protein MreB [Listeria rocourtiae]
MGKVTIGIDIGTANISIYSDMEKMIFHEPTVLAYDMKKNKVLEIGHEAKELAEKTPESIVVLSPLQGGIIADFDMTLRLMQKVESRVTAVTGKRFKQMDLIVSLLPGATNIERQAIGDILFSLGVKSLYFIEGSLAATIGAGLPFEKPIANVIVDIGAGKISTSLVSYGGIVTSSTVRKSGDELDRDIAQLVRNKHNVLIGLETAEQVKWQLHCDTSLEKKMIEIEGRDLVTGFPITIKVPSTEFQEEIDEFLKRILGVVQATLETSPPELSGNIRASGLMLTGGGSLLEGLQDWLHDQILVPIHLAPAPFESVALGTSMAAEHLDKLINVEKVTAR